MSSRGAFIENGHVTTEEYETEKEIEEAKVLKGKGGNHGLPDYSHTAERIYIKENKDGSFRELRVYGKNHKPVYEVGYHGEINLTGNRHKKVLHFHLFTDDLKHLEATLINKDSDFYKKVKKILARYGL